MGGVKDPQALVGVQLKVTPAVLESLATSAAIPAMAPVLMVVGGGKSGSKVTTMAGGWYFGSPQAASAASSDVATTAFVIRRKVGERKLISC